MKRKSILKTSRLFVLVATIFLLAFTSCLNDDNYSLGDAWISLGFIDEQSDSSYDFNIIADNGDTLVPIANAVPYFETYDEQRVLINFTIIDDANDEKTKRFVRINNMQEVLYKTPILLHAENEDSIGNDKVSIKDLWISNHVLNIEFNYAGGSAITHFINLVYEEGALDATDSPIQLEFRHNANDDPRERLLYGIVSFDITMLQSADRDSIEFEVNVINLDGEEESFSETYTY